MNLTKQIKYHQAIDEGHHYAVIFPYYGSETWRRKLSLQLPKRIYRKEKESNEKFQLRVEKEVEKITKKIGFRNGQLWVRFVPNKPRIIEHDYKQNAKTRS
jgi:hypothetical protein